MHKKVLVVWPVAPPFYPMISHRQSIAQLNRITSTSHVGYREQTGIDDHDVDMMSTCRVLVSVDQ